jgi:cbb3-type cytochrome oxidase subunit 3
VFPVISLLLFTAVFGAVLVWAWRADRTRLNHMAALPLDEPTADTAAGDR